MKYDNLHCREPGAGNSYTRPAEEEPKQSNICEVFRLNPDGSIGEHIKTMPGFPEGWDEPKYNVGPKRVKEEENMTEKTWTKKPSNEAIIRTWEDCKHNISAVAKEYSVTWITAKAWLVEAGLMEEKPKKDYFGTPIIEPEPQQEPETGCPVDEPIFNPEPPTKQEPDPLAAELAKLKLDFINLTLASALGDTMKLKVIEYILRM